MLGSKKILWLKINFVVKKNFGSKTICGQKILGSKTFLVQQFFGSKKFESENFFVPKNAGRVNPRGMIYDPTPPRK